MEQTERSSGEIAAAKALEVAHACPELDVRLCGAWVWVQGNTRPKAEELKALGLRWAPKKKQWYWAGTRGRSKKGMSWEYIRDKYGALAPDEIEREVYAKAG